MVLLVERDERFILWAKAELARHCPELGLQLVPDVVQARRWLAMPQAAGLQLAIVDLEPDSEGGIDLVAQLARTHPQVPVMVLTSVRTPEQVARAIDAGVQGYLLKMNIEDEFVRGVRQVLAGTAAISPEIAHLVLSILRSGGCHREARPDVQPASLKASQDLPCKVSARETDVLQLLARGYSDKEVAANLQISPNTVDTHVRAIYRKFKIHSRVQLRRILNA